MAKSSDDRPKVSPDTTQMVTDSQIVAVNPQPPPIPRDPEVSGWSGRPVVSDEFAASAAPARRGRGLWLLFALVVAAAIAVGLVIWSPWSEPEPVPAPAPVPAKSVVSSAPAAPAPAASAPAAKKQPAGAKKPR